MCSLFYMTHTPTQTRMFAPARSAGRKRTVITMRDNDGGSVSLERQWPGAYTLTLVSGSSGESLTAFLGPLHLVRLLLAIRMERNTH